MIDVPNDADVIDMFVYDDSKDLIVASDAGYGFRVKASDTLAQTKTGKQILNVKTPDEALICRAVNDGDDHIAVIGQNRKLLVFPIDELPTMGRGKGVILQRYKDGGLSDLQTFNIENGLGWDYASGTRYETELTPWLGKRAQAGRMPPNGFPRNNKFFI